MRTLAAPDFATLRVLLADEIHRHRADDALRPVTVITPGDLAREATRRDLAVRTGGTLGVTVVSLGEWVRDLVGPEVGRRGGRELGPAGGARLVARLLEDRTHRGGSVGPLGAAARTPGIDRAVGRSLADLRRGGWSAEALAAAWSPAPDPVRRELLEVLRDLERALAGEGLWDRRREERLAADLLGSREDGTPRLFFGFHDLPAAHRVLVEAAAVAGPVSLLVAGPGGTGEVATVPVVDWARTRGEVVFAERDPAPLLTIRDGLFEKPALTDPGPDACELRTYPTEAAEVRGIARRILHEVDRSDRAYDEFLVTVPGDGPSAALFRRIFERAGIPLDDRAGVPASRTASGRRTTILARGLAARPDDPERRSLEFLDLAGELPADLVTAFERPKGWADAVARLRELYELGFSEPPTAEVDAVLEALALVQGNRPCRPRALSRALAAALGTTTHRGRLGGGDDACVLLVHPEGARGIRRPFVWHAGLVEGAVRRLPPEDPLLPDRLRARLADHEGRHVPTRAEAREQKLLLARFAFESASAVTVLSWAERARTGAEPRNPSSLLLDLAGARAAAPLQPGDAAFRAVVPGPVADDAKRTPVDRTDLEVAILAAGEPTTTADIARLAADPRARHVSGALRAAEARWRPGKLTAWDGVLSDARTIEAGWRRIDPARRPPSPTTLETLVNCPFAFLVERVLGLGREPEDEEDFAPMERGLVFHEVVEAVYRRLKDEDRLPLDPSGLDAALAELDAVIARRRRPIELEPPSRRALRRATLAALRDDVAAVLARDAHRPPGDHGVPTWFELPFGMRGDAPGFRLGDGTRLPVRGKADRVDLRGDGSIDVVDLKTGKPRVKSGRVTSTDREKTAVHLQLPLYLECVAAFLGRRPGRALFYHATSDSGFEEIVLDADDLETRREPLGRLLSGVIAQAKRGWFPCTPGETCCRRRLAPACGPAVAARFRRKRTDPDVAAHLARIVAVDPGHET